MNIKRKNPMKVFRELKMFEMANLAPESGKGMSVTVQRVPGGHIYTTGAGEGKWNSVFAPDPQAETVIVEEKIDLPEVHELAVELYRYEDSGERENGIQILLGQLSMEIDILEGYTSYPQTRIDRLSSVKRFLLQELKKCQND